jgi:AraC-like DNA-binding protein
VTEIAFQAFTDPDAYYAAIRNAVEGIVTARGDYHAEFTRVDFNRLWMSHGRESLARVGTYTPRWERTTLLFATDQDQPATHIAGIEVLPDEIAVVSFGSGDHLRTSAATRWGGVSLPCDDLAVVGQAISGRELTPPSFTHRIKPATIVFARLRNLHKAARHLAKTAPDILAKPEVARAMEEALQEAMVLSLGGAEPAEVPSSHVRHATVLRRLEDFIRANPDETLFVSQLCAATGVSQRTLLACCHEHLGMGPKRYLLLRRMHLAHRALRLADPSATTVTEIATNFGFWEFGRFSVVYRSLFGETPSASLRRTPDDPGPPKNAGSPWQLAEIA